MSDHILPGTEMEKSGRHSAISLSGSKLYPRGTRVEFL